MNEKYYNVVIDKVEKTLEVLEVKSCNAEMIDELAKRYGLNRCEANRRFKLCDNGTESSINYNNVYKYARKYEVISSDKQEVSEEELNTQLKDIEAPTVDKKCLYISNNKAVARNKKVISLQAITGNKTLNNLYIEKMDGSILLYVNFNGVCVYMCSANQYVTVKDLATEVIEKDLNNYTYEKERKRILNNANNNQFINVQDIKLFELMGEPKEVINSLVNARMLFIEQKEAKREQERKAREEAEAQFIREKNSIIDNLVKEAEQNILNGSTVTNKDIKVYNNKYDYKDTSLLLYMFNVYGIKVPLKTQGWINNALVDIYYNNESWTYRYYSSSKNSTVFQEYLDSLIEAVKVKYGVSEAATEDFEETEAKEYEKNIPDLKFTKVTGSMRALMDINRFRHLPEYEPTAKERIQIFEMMYKHLKVNVSEAITNRLLFDFDNSLNVDLGGKEIVCYTHIKNDKVCKLFVKHTKKDTYVCYYN